MSVLSPPVRGLVWKEARQIMPLVWMLLGVTALIVFFWLLTGAGSRELANAGQFIPLVIPALYAAGVGAISVSQEKEMRTLQWIGGLPISARMLFTVKLAMAMLGLIAMWVFCTLLSISFGSERAFVGTDSVFVGSDMPVGDLYGIVYTVFLLFCGFYTAWRVQNAFSGLLWMLPLAVFPTFLAGSYAHYRLVTYRNRLLPYEVAEIGFWLTVPAIPIVAWFAWRAASRALQPASAPTLPPIRSAAHLDAWRPPETVTPSVRPFRYPISSLVWQSIHHHRGVLLGIAAMIFIGASCLWTVMMQGQSWRTSWQWEGSMLMLAAVGLLGISWAGVSAFAGDGSSPRLKFLADRSVSPRKAWFGCHLVGISLVCFGLLVYAATQGWFWVMDQDHVPPVPSVAMVGLLALLIYSVSQWTSQVVRILAASAFLAPLLSVFAFGWLVFAALSLECPLWLLVACAAIPLVATLCMMRQHMDGRRGLTFWATSILIVFLFVGLPIVPAAIDISRFPKVTSKRLAEIGEQAKQLPTGGLSAVSMRRESTLERDWELYQPDQIDGKKAAEILSTLSDDPSSFLPIGSNTDRPLTADVGIVNAVIGTTTLHQLAWLAKPEDGESKRLLGEWMETLTTIAIRLRKSDHLVAQEVADTIEIWLTQTINDPAMQTIRSEPFIEDAIALIADSQGRAFARRRAVLASWKKLALIEDKMENPSRPYGGYNRYEWFEYLTETKRSWVVVRGTNKLTDLLLRLIEAGENDQPTEPVLRELHALMMGRRQSFEDGLYGEDLRANASTPAIYHRLLPGRQWFAPWENVAAQLGRDASLETQPATTDGNSASSRSESRQDFRPDGFSESPKVLTTFATRTMEMQR